MCVFFVPVAKLPKPSPSKRKITGESPVGDTKFMGIYTEYLDNSDYIELTDFEFDVAWKIGDKIWRLSQERGLKDYCGNKPNGVDGGRLQCLGAVAECAIHKWLNRFWLGNYNSFKNPDLADLEIRLIGLEHYGLRVRDSDDDSRRVVGIVIPKGREREPFRIAGWIYAREAKKTEWKMNPYNGRPIYCVPQTQLFPAGILKEEFSPQIL